MLNTIALWAVLILTCAAAVRAAVDSRRTRRAVEALLQPSPLPAPQPIPEPTGSGGPGPFRPK